MSIWIGRSKNQRPESKPCRPLKQFRDKVVKEINDKKRQKDAKEGTLRDLQTELTSQSMVLSDSARRQRKRGYRRQVRDLRKFIEDSIALSRNLSAICVSVRLSSPRVCCETCSKSSGLWGGRESFTIIFERNDRVLLFAAEPIDLTEKIIKRFDTVRR